MMSIMSIMSYIQVILIYLGGWMRFDLFDSLRPIQVVHMKPGLRTWQEVSCSKACLLIRFDTVNQDGLPF